MPNRESFTVPDHWSERKKDIHELILEFRQELTKNNYEVPVNTDGVVCLTYLDEKEGKKIIENNPENIARLKFSLDIIKRITAQKINKSIDQITAEDLAEHGPDLIINGEDELIPVMAGMAIEEGFPENKIKSVYCGPAGTVNTKTQCDMLNNISVNEAKHLTMISSSYHSPRVARTADKNLKNIEFDVIGVPFQDLQYNVFRKVRGELKRILEYREKGDIS